MTVSFPLRCPSLFFRVLMGARLRDNGGDNVHYIEVSVV